MPPLSTQMLQQNEKYRKAANRVGACLDLRKALKKFTGGDS